MHDLPARPRAAARPLLAVLAAVAVAVAVLLVGPAGAPAGAEITADGGVQVSRDGATWSEQVDGPLFSPDLAWQPGEVRTSSLLVRNATGDTTDVEVRLERRAGDAALDPLVTTSARLPGDEWSTALPGGPAQVIVVEDLLDGATATVALRTALSSSAPVGTVVDTSTLDVTAAPAGGAGVVPTSGDPDGGGRGTGGTRAGGDPDDGFLSSAQLELAPVFLGFALVVAVLVQRRRSQDRRGGPPGLP